MFWPKHEERAAAQERDLKRVQDRSAEARERSDEVIREAYRAMEHRLTAKEK